MIMASSLEAKPMVATEFLILSFSSESRNLKLKLATT
jgi:hypothetical protein